MKKTIKPGDLVVLKKAYDKLLVWKSIKNPAPGGTAKSSETYVVLHVDKTQIYATWLGVLTPSGICYLSETYVDKL